MVRPSIVLYLITAVLATDSGTTAAASRTSPAAGNVSSSNVQVVNQEASWVAREKRQIREDARSKIGRELCD